MLLVSALVSAGAQRVAPLPKRTGDAACLTCHQRYSQDYQHTAHHLTSQLAGPASILGPFTGGASALKILEPDPQKHLPGLSFQMELKDGVYSQTATAGVANHTKSHSARVDVVTGSGKRGQSYLYWLGDQLFELPLSYWTDGQQWINSPGFKDQTANFSRPIFPRCLECHATAIVPLSSDPLANRYDKESLVTGIACETCHGPGARHIAQHATESVAEPRTILNPALFARDRQVDLCALCHSGAQRVQLKPAFSYIPGEPLDDYLRPAPADASLQPEVHGNQVGLLKKSRCYLSSPNMSCSTCHDVHYAEQPAASYASRCLSCHQPERCKMSKTLGATIVTDCIRCHMPEQPTNAIVSQTAGKVTRAVMRTHWIRVYPAVDPP